MAMRCLIHVLVCLLAVGIATAHAESTEDLSALNRQVVELYRVGKYAEAILIAQRVLAISEKKALGPDHPYVAGALNNLAEMYLNQGHYAEAEPLFKRSLSIREKGLGPDHPDVANSLNNLAELYRSQGRYAEAKPLSKRSLSIREKALGPDHPAVANSLNNLAGLYRAQDRYTEAEPLLKRSLSIWEKALGPNHPHVATSLSNLGSERDDLVAEWQAKDRLLDAALSQPPKKRDKATEEALRERMAAIDARLAEIDARLLW